MILCLSHSHGHGEAEEDFDPNAGSTVNAIVLQPDGRILVGGAFTTLGGSSINRLALLNPNGTPDPGFLPNPSGTVNTLLLQADGKIMVGGNFALIAGSMQSHVARLNPDGTPDASFRLIAPGGEVNAVAAQSDGRTLIGGAFTTIGTTSRTRIARLLADGSLDTAFNPGANGTVNAITLLADGKILVGGAFTTIGNQPRPYLARLNSNGTVDTAFNATVGSSVNTITVQPDGRIVIGGSFSTVGGQTRLRIARLHPDGTLDTAFNPAANGTVNTIALQADGKIWAGGSFTTIGGQPRSRIARLDADGVADPGIVPEADNTVNTLALQADGKVLAGGTFANIRGLPRSRIARLSNDPAISELSVIGNSEVLWQRGGAAPEVERVEIESTVGGSWISAGTATRVANGWQLTGLSLPEGTWVRARGRCVGGRQSGNAGWISAITAHGIEDFPQISVSIDEETLTPGESVVNFGSSTWRQPSDPVTLTITNTGNAPLTHFARSFAGQHGTEFSADEFPAASLAPGESMSFGIHFIPTGAGTRVGEIQIDSSDVLASPIRITLQGSAVHGDTTFTPAMGGDIVNSIAVQPDGKILVGGNFTTISGRTRWRIARLNPNGTVDENFNPMANGSVTSIVPQPDGKILIGGSFTTVGGQLRSRLARLNPDGTLDAGFSPEIQGTVLTICLQSDGKILLGGRSMVVDGESIAGLARLEPDGTLDPGFTHGAASPVHAVAIQADGKILVGGQFTTLGGAARSNIGRLNPNGTLDTTFNPGANDTIHILVVQPDGKILVGGSFTTIANQPRSRIARLNSNGSLDATFFSQASGTVNAIALQANGRMLVGGSFASIGGRARAAIARLLADGSADPGFDPGSNTSIQTIALQADGGVLVGGGFTIIGGRSRSRLARLQNDPAQSDLSVTGTSEITWLRGGTAPEVDRVAFDYMAAGTWTPVGTATRVPGGWQATGLSLPASTWLRARGTVIRGENSKGSSGIVGEIITYGGTEFPQITVHTDGEPIISGNGQLDFGTKTWRESSAPISVTITNTGTAPLIGLALTLRGLHPSDFSASGLNHTTLDPQQSTTFTITFTPTGGGPRQALLQIPNNDGSASPFLIHLSGSGIQSDPGFTPSANGNVNTIATQADGRILIGGEFTRIDPQFRPYLARLHPNGEVDGTLAPDIDGAVNAIVVQADGGILLGGTFTRINGQPRQNLARLHADGLLDETFTAGTNGTINAIAVLADGAILLGGSFAWVSGHPRQNLARLHPDGTLDHGFVPQSDGAVHTLARQPDGAILVGGTFTSLGGQERLRLARLDANGTLDAGFNPAANGTVNVIALQADGTILAGGAFTSIGGQTRMRIARLQADGTLDAGFNPAVDSTIHTIGLQADGAIWIGGEFTTISNMARSRIARLNADGTVDIGIDPTSSGAVNAIVLQTDGGVLAGGAFTTLGGAPTARIARLPNDPATSELSVSGTSEVLWLRGGSAPEIGRVEFEYHVGGTWISAGPVTRIPGGWQATGLSLPPSTWLRARGDLAGGRYNGSSGSVSESITYGGGAFPQITVQAQGSPLISGNGYLDLGGTPWKESSDPVTVSISNTGSAPLSGFGFHLSGADSDQFQINPSPLAVLAPGESMDITITFTATREGLRGALLSITSNDFSATPFQIFLKAVGERCDPQFNAAADAWVTAITHQRDGRILVGGDFTEIAGQQRSGLARFDPDGTLDETFTPDVDGPASSKIFAISVQDDGRILLAGAFTGVNGVARNRIARLLEDGTLDADFDPDANATIKAMAVQPDGKILIGGDFSTISGTSRTRIARLHPDGTLDSGFSPALQDIRTLALQQDGKILVGMVSNGMTRLHPDGTTDTGFNKPAFMRVNAFVEQPDGKILVAGLSNVSNRPNIIRLNPDGTQETGFLASANSWIDALALQADGRILIGGDFTDASGQPRDRVARLNPDGSIDPNFNPGADGWVNGINIDADGKILLSGQFDTISGQARPCIARLLNEPATSELTVKPNGRIDWTPGGSMPSVHRVEVEIQQGTEWLPLGSAQRQDAGWRLTGHPLPESATLRFQCRYSGGIYNASTGFVTVVQSYTGYDFTGYYEGWDVLPDLPADRRDRLDTNGPLNLPNLLAYAMGINPLTAQPAEMPAFLGHTANPNRGIVRFRINPESLDTTLQIWASPDLEAGSWLPAVIHSQSILQAGAGWREIEAVVDLPASGKGFFRWSVEPAE